VACVIGKLLDGPLILVHIVAKTNFGIDIISKQIDVRLTPGASVERWEFEKSFLNRPIIIDVDCILEHVVYEIWVGLDEVIQS
jgi:hypothetical protein